MSAKTLLTDLLKQADIEVNGKRPWDIQVHDERLYAKVRWWVTLGLGEAYMDGWWDAKQLDEFFVRVLRAELYKGFTPWKLLPWYLARRFGDRGALEKAFRVGEVHYDIGNDLFEAMLDRRLVYSCGYWKNTQTLDEAQEAKLDLICRKLGLEIGMKVLDIGCGWGSFLKLAAEKYGVSGVGITVSKEQAEFAQKNCSELPIEIRLEDYRETRGQFDRVVSIGMFEHVGYKHYREYMQNAARFLKEDGLFLLHTIGRNTSVKMTDPFVDKYIFPDGMVPSITQIGAALEGVFVMEDWHNFGQDYDKTLMVWYANLEKHWAELSERYDERFRRMWRYYLLSCAAAFRIRRLQLWQVVLSKKGVVGGYQSVR